jgi:hypothetical protein
VTPFGGYCSKTKTLVRTVAYNGISAAGFTMEPSDRIVMVTVDNKADQWGRYAPCSS